MIDILPFEASPAEVQQRAAAGEKLRLIDVREPDEYEVARIEGADLVPMGTIPAHLQQLEQLADQSCLIVYCHHGIRSANVVQWLRAQGLNACQNLAGGIDRWSLEIDSAVPRY